MKQYLFLILIVLNSACSSDIDRHLSTMDQQVVCEKAIPNRAVSIGVLPIDDKQRKVFFKDEVGFTVGDNGTIVKSIDGGLTWEVKLKFDEVSPLEGVNLTNAKLLTIHLPTTDVGYAAGQGEYDYVSKKETDAIFLTTEDGGESWNKAIIKDCKVIYDLLFFNETEGIAMLEIDNPFGPRKMNIYSTTDAGYNWREATLSIRAFISSELTLVDNRIIFLAENHIAEPVIVQSIDKGKTWATYVTPDRNCRKLQYFSEELSYLMCDNRLYQSGRDLSNWVLVDDHFNQQSFVHFFSNMEGFVIDPIYEKEEDGETTNKKLSGYQLKSTTDAGRSWSTRVLSTSCELNGPKHNTAEGLLHILNSSNEVITIQ